MSIPVSPAGCALFGKVLQNGSCAGAAGKDTLRLSKQTAHPPTLAEASSEYESLEASTSMVRGLEVVDAEPVSASSLQTEKLGDLVRPSTYTLARPGEYGVNKGRGEAMLLCPFAHRNAGSPELSPDLLTGDALQGLGRMVCAWSRKSGMILVQPSGHSIRRRRLRSALGLLCNSSGAAKNFRRSSHQSPPGLPMSALPACSKHHPVKPSWHEAATNLQIS